MNTIFTIETGVPVPPVTTRQGHNIALLKAMAPGDSVYFDAPIAKHATRFYRVAKKLRKQIMIRKDGISGMRLWMLGDEVADPAPRRAVVAKVVIAKIAKRSVITPDETAYAKARKVVTANESTRGTADGLRDAIKARNTTRQAMREAVAGMHAVQHAATKKETV